SKIDEIEVKFSLEGVEVVLERVTANGIVRDTLAPDAQGWYSLDYADLDKIRVRPPKNFSGELMMEVTIHYQGLDPVGPHSLSIDVLAVSDAPSGASATMTLAEDTVHTFAVADFGFTDALDGPNRGASSLLDVQIVTLSNAGKLLLVGKAVTAGHWV